MTTPVRMAADKIAAAQASHVPYVAAEAAIEGLRKYADRKRLAQLFRFYREAGERGTEVDASYIEAAIDAVLGPVKDSQHESEG